MYVPGIKFGNVLRVLVIFCGRKKKMDQNVCTKFGMELSIPKHVKCWQWYAVSVLSVKKMFINGTSSSKKAEKMIVTQLIVDMRRLTVKFVLKVLNFDQKNLLTHRCLWVILLLETPQPYFRHLHFLFLNMRMKTYERTEICNDWRDKECIAGIDLGYTNKCLRIGKALAQVYISTTLRMCYFSRLFVIFLFVCCKMKHLIGSNSVHVYI